MGYFGESFDNVDTSNVGRTKSKRDRLKEKRSRKDPEDYGNDPKAVQWAKEKFNNTFVEDGKDSLFDFMEVADTPYNINADGKRYDGRNININDMDQEALLDYDKKIRVDESADTVLYDYRQKDGLNEDGSQKWLHKTGVTNTSVHGRVGGELEDKGIEVLRERRTFDAYKHEAKIKGSKFFRDNRAIDYGRSTKGSMFANGHTEYTTNSIFGLSENTSYEEAMRNNRKSGEDYLIARQQQIDYPNTYEEKGMNFISALSNSAVTLFGNIGAGITPDGSDMNKWLLSLERDAAEITGYNPAASKRAAGLVEEGFQDITDGNLIEGIFTAADGFTDSGNIDTLLSSFSQSAASSMAVKGGWVGLSIYGLLVAGKANKTLNERKANNNGAENSMGQIAMATIGATAIVAIEGMAWNKLTKGKFLDKTVTDALYGKTSYISGSNQVIPTLRSKIPTMTAKQLTGASSAIRQHIAQNPITYGLIVAGGGLLVKGAEKALVEGVEEAVVQTADIMMSKYDTTKFESDSMAEIFMDNMQEIKKAFYGGLASGPMGSVVFSPIASVNETGRIIKDIGQESQALKTGVSPTYDGRTSETIVEDIKARDTKVNDVTENGPSFTTDKNKDRSSAVQSIEDIKNMAIEDNKDKTSFSIADELLTDTDNENAKKSMVSDTEGLSEEQGAIVNESNEMLIKLKKEALKDTAEERAKFGEESVISPEVFKELGLEITDAELKSVTTFNKKIKEYRQGLLNKGTEESLAIVKELDVLVLKTHNAKKRNTILNERMDELMQTKPAFKNKYAQLLREATKIKNKAELRKHKLQYISEQSSAKMKTKFTAEVHANKKAFNKIKSVVTPSKDGKYDLAKIYDSMTEMLSKEYKNNKAKTDDVARVQLLASAVLSMKPKSAQKFLLQIADGLKSKDKIEVAKANQMKALLNTSSEKVAFKIVSDSINTAISEMQLKNKNIKGSHSDGSSSVDATNAAFKEMYKLLTTLSQEAQGPFEDVVDKLKEASTKTGTERAKAFQVAGDTMKVAQEFLTGGGNTEQTSIGLLHYKDAIEDGKTKEFDERFFKFVNSRFNKKMNGTTSPAQIRAISNVHKENIRLSQFALKWVSATKNNTTLTQEQFAQIEKFANLQEADLTYEAMLSQTQVKKEFKKSTQTKLSEKQIALNEKRKTARNVINELNKILTKARTNLDESTVFQGNINEKDGSKTFVYHYTVKVDGVNKSKVFKVVYKADNTINPYKTESFTFKSTDTTLEATNRGVSALLRVARDSNQALSVNPDSKKKKHILSIGDIAHFAYVQGTKDKDGKLIAPKIHAWKNLSEIDGHENAIVHELGNPAYIKAEDKAWSHNIHSTDSLKPITLKVEPKKPQPTKSTVNNNQQSTKPPITEQPKQKPVESLLEVDDTMTPSEVNPFEVTDSEHNNNLNNEIKRLDEVDVKALKETLNQSISKVRDSIKDVMKYVRGRIKYRKTVKSEEEKNDIQKEIDTYLKQISELKSDMRVEREKASTHATMTQNKILGETARRIANTDENPVSYHGDPDNKAKELRELALNLSENIRVKNSSNVLSLVKKMTDATREVIESINEISTSKIDDIDAALNLINHSDIAKLKEQITPDHILTMNEDKVTSLMEMFGYSQEVDNKIGDKKQHVLFYGIMREALIEESINLATEIKFFDKQTDNSIAKMLGFRDADDAKSKNKNGFHQIAQDVRNNGIFLTHLLESSGQKVAQTVGIKIGKEVDSKAKRQLELEMGLFVKHMLIQSGQILHTHTVNSIDETPATYNLYAPVDDSVLWDADADILSDYTKVTSKLLDIHSLNAEPVFGRDSYIKPDKTIRGSEDKVDAITYKWLEERSNIAYSPNEAGDFINDLTEEQFMKLIGFKSGQELDEMIPSKKQSQIGKNIGLMNMIEASTKYYAEAKEKTFKVPYFQTKVLRNNIISPLDPQGNTIHRFMYSPDEMRSIVILKPNEYGSEPNSLRVFKLGLAQSFDIGLDKMTDDEALVELDKLVKIKFYDGKLSVQPNKEVGEALSSVDAKVDFASGLKGTHTILGLQSLESLIKATEDGKTDFETDLVIEEDGITSGMVLALLGLGLNLHTAPLLMMGGVYTQMGVDSMKETLSPALAKELQEHFDNGSLNHGWLKSKANMVDYYEIVRDSTKRALEGDPSNFVPKYLRSNDSKANEKAHEIYLFLDALKLSINRNQSKVATTSTIYGAGKKSTQNNIFYEIILPHIEEKNKNNETPIGQLTTDVDEDGLFADFFSNQIANVKGKLSIKLRVWVSSPDGLSGKIETLDNNKLKRLREGKEQELVDNLVRMYPHTFGNLNFKILKENELADRLEATWKTKDVVLSDAKIKKIKELSDMTVAEAFLTALDENFVELNEQRETVQGINRAMHIMAKDILESKIKAITEVDTDFSKAGRISTQEVDAIVKEMKEQKVGYAVDGPTNSVSFEKYEKTQDGGMATVPLVSNTAKSGIDNKTAETKDKELVNNQSSATVSTTLAIDGTSIKAAGSGTIDVFDAIVYGVNALNISETQTDYNKRTYDTTQNNNALSEHLKSLVTQIRYIMRENDQAHLNKLFRSIMKKRRNELVELYTKGKTGKKAIEAEDKALEKAFGEWSTIIDSANALDKMIRNKEKMAKNKVLVKHGYATDLDTTYISEADGTNPNGGSKLTEKDRKVLSQFMLVLRTLRGEPVATTPEKPMTSETPTEKPKKKLEVIKEKPKSREEKIQEVIRESISGHLMAHLIILKNGIVGLGKDITNMPINDIRFMLNRLDGNTTLNYKNLNTVFIEHSKLNKWKNPSNNKQGDVANYLKTNPNAVEDIIDFLIEDYNNNNDVPFSLTPDGSETISHIDTRDITRETTHDLLSELEQEDINLGYTQFAYETEHSDALSEILNETIDTVFSIEDTVEFTKSETDGHTFGYADTKNFSINVTGSTESVIQTRRSVFSHEMFHLATDTAIKVDKTILSRLNRIKDAVKAHIESEGINPRVMFSRDGSKEQGDVSQRIYDRIFDSSAEEFFVYSMTDPVLFAYINENQDDFKVNNTLFKSIAKHDSKFKSLIIGMYNLILKVINAGYKAKHKSKNAFDELVSLRRNSMALTVRIKNGKYQNGPIYKAVGAVNNALSKPTKALIASLNEVSLKHIGPVDEKLARLYVRTRNKKAKMFIKFGVDMIHMVVHSTDKDPRFIKFYQAYNEIKKIQEDDVAHDKAVITSVLSESLKGYDLDDKIAIQKLLVDTDISSVSTDESFISELLNDDTLLKRETKVLQDKLHSMAKTDKQKTFLKMAILQGNGLASYMTTGHSGIQRQMLNASNIANGLFLSNTDRSNTELISEMTETLDKFISLRALSRVKNKHSLDMTKNKNGISDLLTFEKNSKLEQNKLNFSNKNSEIYIQKGYSKEIIENSVEVKIISAEERVDHEKAGWKVYQEDMDLPTHKFDDVDNNRLLMTREDFSPSYSKGAIEVTNYHHNGSTIREFHKNSDSIIKDDLARGIVEDITNEEFDLRADPYNGNQPIPLFNISSSDNIKIGDYRYVMGNQLKDEIFKENNNVVTKMAETVTSIGAKITGKANNEKMIDLTNKEYELADETDKKSFIQVNAKSKEYKEHWDTLPDYTKAYMKENNIESIYVRVELINEFFGYQDFSVANSSEHIRTKKPRLHKGLQMIEAFIKSLTKLFKPIIAIKSSAVVYGNILSNYISLVLRGINPITAAKDLIHGAKGLAEMKELQKELRGLEIKGKMNHKNSVQIRRVKQRIKENIMYDLHKAGLVSSVVEDINKESLSETNRISKITNKKLDKTIGDGAIREAVSNAYVSSSTKLFEIMLDMTQMGDAAARYSLHKHNLRKGMLMEESLGDVAQAFIMYNGVKNQFLGTLDQMGLLLFMNFFLKNARVATNMFLAKPASVMAYKELHETRSIDQFDTYDNGLFGGLANRLYNPISNVETVATPHIFEVF